MNRICILLLVACPWAGCSRSSSPPPVVVVVAPPVEPMAEPAETPSSQPAEDDGNNPFADSQRIVIEDAPAKSGDVPALESEPVEPGKSLDEYAESVVRAIRRGVEGDEPRENTEPSIFSTIGRALGKGLVEGVK